MSLMTTFNYIGNAQKKTSSLAHHVIGLERNALEHFVKLPLNYAVAGIEYTLHGERSPSFTNLLSFYCHARIISLSGILGLLLSEQI